MILCRNRCGIRYFRTWRNIANFILLVPLISSILSLTDKVYLMRGLCCQRHGHLHHCPHPSTFPSNHHSASNGRHSVRHFNGGIFSKFQFCELPYKFVLAMWSWPPSGEWQYSGGRGGCLITSSSPLADRQYPTNIFWLCGVGLPVESDGIVAAGGSHLFISSGLLADHWQS